MSTMCMNPFTLSEENGSYQVPCGKCYNCKSRRAQGWALRLQNELKYSDTAYFIGLDYKPSTIPISPGYFQTLDKKHLQNFFKRLRKKHPKENKTIKYYAVGEYGGKKYRPHYHIILFNALQEHIETSWTDCIDKRNQKFSKLGRIHYGDVTPESVTYTLKYICKSKRIPVNDYDDRIPEFALMSKGLGKNYLTEKMIAWHKAKPSERMYAPHQGGMKTPLPRYIKQRLNYTDEEKAQAELYHKMIADANREKEILSYGDNYQSFKEQQYFDGNRKLKLNSTKHSNHEFSN